jgi:hypothetical protein
MIIPYRHGSHYELVDSEAQWKEVQRKQAEGGTGIHQATVVTNRRSGYMNSGMETESELSYHHKRKQKKHRYACGLSHTVVNVNLHSLTNNIFASFYSSQQSHFHN